VSAPVRSLPALLTAATGKLRHPGQYVSTVLVLIPVLLAALYCLRETRWEWWGVYQLTPVFADLRVITAAWESRALGLDPLVSNPFDPWNRVLNYPRIWELPGLLGLRGSTDALAAMFWLSFFAGVIALGRRQPWPTQLMLAGLLVSPSVMFALERANSDLLIFALCVLIVNLSEKRPQLAAFLSLGGFALKFYPLVLLALLDWSKREVRRAVAGAMIFAGGVTLFTFDDILAIRAGTPLTESQSYGVACLGEWFASAHPDWWTTINTLQIGFALLPLVGAFVWTASKIPAASTLKTERLFLAGALLYAGTFVLGSNYDYRFIVLLLCVPWLVEQGTRNRAWYLVIAMVAFVLWQIKIERLAWFYAVPMNAVMLVTQGIDWALYLVFGFFASIACRDRLLSLRQGTQTILPDSNAAAIGRESTGDVSGKNVVQS
jgi:hypothetical protein